MPLLQTNRNHPKVDEPIEAAVYVENNVVPAMAAVREVADELEGVVPDSLWPLWLAQDRGLFRQSRDHDDGTRRSRTGYGVAR